MGAQQQHQLNLEIAAKVKESARDILNGRPVTQTTVEYLQGYTGSGGLIKQGASDRGVLYEYYTPYPIVQAMWALAYRHGFTSGHILEPSCGVGRFLRFIDPTTCTVDAYEYSKDNQTSYLIARASFPWANITNNYFESIFYQGNKRVGKEPVYDLVIGNPPYGAFSGAYSGKQREGKHFAAVTYDQYFIQAGLSVLKPGGLLVFIIPSGFLENGHSYDKVKTEIAAVADLVDAYRLPERVFDFTGIGTDIVVFKKKA